MARGAETTGSAAAFVPATRSLASLQAAAAGCRGCDLWRRGPAGRLLDQALAAAGVARADVYVTNVVKHFKWEPRGKRRIHAKPSRAEVGACLPWLRAELELVRPEAVVCLGATAAQALLGPTFRVTRQRGEWMGTAFAARVMATVHPSAILRAPDDAARRVEMARFVEDLATIPARLAA